MASPVKIVLINTQYVETDETSFKSVVQELTGKDAHPHAHAGVSSDSVSRAREKERLQHQVHHHHHHHHQPSVDFGGSILMRDLSFKEFDRLLKEISSIDELHGFWAD